MCTWLSLLWGVPPDVSSLDDAVILFTFSKSLRPAFPGGCTVRHRHARARAPVPPTSWPALGAFPSVSACSLSWWLQQRPAVPTGARCCLVMVSMCVSLMIRDAEHLSMCLLPTCISSLQKFLFKFFAHLNHGALRFVRCCCC